MGTSALIVALVAMAGTGAPISQRAFAKQNEVFQQYWGTEFVWKFDELPTSGTIPNARLPYSGYIYPDRSGGTSSALRKYDLAFNGGRMRATAFEQWDTSAFKKPTEERAGVFGLRTRTVMETPNWHGHCNGWVAATIRHAEPQNSVRMNGVTFSPADIKALLAEIYIYNDIDHLAGLDWPMNAGLLHTILANWLGRGAHPVGMEAMPGPEKWNYPIYSFASDSAKRSSRQVEVKTNIAYAKDSNGEYQESPHIRRVKYFHYMLTLNDRGEIIGGSFLNDSSIIDMLWIPLRPKQGGAKGNEPGNPHVDVDKVLAVWRASVPEEDRRQWLTVDPAERDRVTDTAGIETLIPVQFVGAPQMPGAARATVATPATPAPTAASPTADIRTPAPPVTTSTARSEIGPEMPSPLESSAGESSAGEVSQPESAASNAAPEVTPPTSSADDAGPAVEF